MSYAHCLGHHTNASGSIEDDGWLNRFFRKVSDKTKHLFLPYPLNEEKKRHGLALVIVNEKFESHPKHPQKSPLRTRDCARFDLDHLKKVFEKFHFEVRVAEDRTAEEMESLFKEVRVPGDPTKTVQDGDDSFVCCISSHGYWDPVLNTDVVFGKTGAIIEEGSYKIPKGALDVKKHAYKSFSPLQDGCPVLRGRPKLFIVQACRGSDHGIITSDDSGADILAAKPRHLPREADFLFAYATAPGNKAYRNDPTDIHVPVRQVDQEGRPFGSFFISYLCANLTKYMLKNLH